MMIPTNITKRKIEFYKLAKEQSISMTLCTEEEIEVNESEKSKFNKFARSIKEISPGTKIKDLVSGKETECIRGYNIEGDKALYLTDDNYYKKLIGEVEEIEEEQLSLL